MSSYDSYVSTQRGSNCYSRCMALTFDSVDEIPKRVRLKKATERKFPVVLYIILYKQFLTYDSVDEVPKCEHSTESY